MVNAEGEANEEAMGMSIALWSLLFYVCVILIWNVYTFENKIIVYVLRGMGVIGLLILALIYRGGEDGTEMLQPHWWGNSWIDWMGVSRVVYYVPVSSG